MQRQALLLFALLASCGTEGQLVEFHGQNGKELATVSADWPVRIDVLGRPPVFARPLVQVYLLLDVQMAEPSSPRSGRLGWMFSAWSLLNQQGENKQMKIDVETGPPGFLCHFVGSWLRPVLPKLCKDCTNQCAADVHPWGEDRVAVTLPATGHSVYIRKLPTSVERVRASWHWQLDHSVFLFLLIGLTLVLAWKPLSDSALLHASLGGIGSLVFISLMVIFWMARSARGAVHGTIPFGRTLTTLAATIFAFIPAARNAVLDFTLGFLPAPDWQQWFRLRDPWFELPIGGLAFLLVVVACLVLVHLGASLALRYFAALPEPEGAIDFIIGGDGRRVDFLPPAPISRRMLGWSIWLLGIGLLLSSTHSDACSLAVVVAALLKDRVTHWVSIAMMWRKVDLQPKDIHTLISPSQMHAQADATTRDAVAQLQKYLKENPSAAHRVREDSELSLRRFVVDGVHVRPPLTPVDEASRPMCLLQ
mmetsp:Transcript_33697/g.75650  ORF Transcript_33697/g.75650 Transcript_33697/m.75650 type:complete len:478 (-) Transcript_33697:37-1470(-)